MRSDMPTANFSRIILALFILSHVQATIGMAEPETTSPIRIRARERQLTRGPGGRILTNIGVWSPDGQWIVYDTRSDPAGTVFDGDTIEMVNVVTSEVRPLYHSTNGSHCGAATFHPRDQQIVFMQGPENPTPEWSYGPYHRQGALVDLAHPGEARTLDARNLTPPFTPAALRG